MSVLQARFLACPVVWEYRDGLAVAVFLDRARAEAVVRAAPDPPEGGWRLFPMNELELLGWLRQQRAQGVSLLLLDPEINAHDPSTAATYVIDLPGLLGTGKTLELFRRLADIHEAGATGS
jgi:hypothetical protein